MKTLYPDLIILDIRCVAGITQKSGAAAFPLWSLQKQNSCVKRNENNMKDIVVIPIIIYWRFHLR